MTPRVLRLRHIGIVVEPPGAAQRCPLHHIAEGIPPLPVMPLGTGQPRKDLPGGKVAEYAEIGRASCRERVCQYVSSSVVAGSLKKNIRTITQRNKVIEYIISSTSRFI